MSAPIPQADEPLAAPIPPDEPRLKRASLMAFGVISEIRKLVGNGKVQFVADLGGSIWTWPDAADSAITELKSVCFDTALIPPTANVKIVAEMIREAEAHLPRAIKTPPARWQWMADYLNESMADPGKLCPCCNVNRLGELMDHLAPPPKPPGDL